MLKVTCIIWVILLKCIPCRDHVIQKNMAEAHSVTNTTNKKRSYKASLKLKVVEIQQRISKTFWSR